MNHMRSYLLAITICLPLVEGMAQSFRKILERPVNIIRSAWEKDQNGNTVLNYYNDDYCHYYLYQVNDKCYKLIPGKNTVFRDDKQSQVTNSTYKSESPGSTQYSVSYMYFRGSFPKSFNINTPYALPVKNGMKTGWKTDVRESYKTLRFRITQGDTVYATRGGVACSTVLPRQLLIYHADCTFAAYLAMDKNFISPGDEVHTGQPVGIAGSAGVPISFFFLDENKFAGMEASGYAYSHFIPVFRTADGDKKLEEKVMYEALVNDELIMLDMNKREQKKYLKHKR